MTTPQMDLFIDDNANERIAIVGLSNAGKTSILRVLTKEFDMLTKIRPTQFINHSIIEIFSKSLMFWDFGGQELYCNQYLANPARYFSNTSQLFYVIDIHATSKIQENINYFLKILKNLKRYSPDVKINILFHKDDPNIDVDINIVKQFFLDGILDSLLKSEIPITMYVTSIYRPLSIITAFSQPFLNQKDIYHNISDMLKVFVDLYNLEFAILFAKDYFELGSFFKNQQKLQVDKLLTIFFQKPGSTYKQIVEISNPEITSQKLLVSHFALKVGYSELPFYLMICFNEQDSVLDKEDMGLAMRKLTNNFSKLLSNMDLFNIDISIANEIKTELI